MGPRKEHGLEGLIEIVDAQGDAIQQAELPFAVAKIKRPISKTELYATQTSPKREALRIFDSFGRARAHRARRVRQRRGGLGQSRLNDGSSTVQRMRDRL